MGEHIGYIRVSALDQNAERQLESISLDRFFEDKASGKDTKRPKLDSCLNYVREGDVLYVHSIDRLARNLEDLQSLVRKLKDKGVTIKFVKENLTFHAVEENPMQTLMFQMLGAFAQFERALIRERQREGIALAKKEGRQLGRAKALNKEQEEAIKVKIVNGAKKHELAAEYGISRQTVYRILGRQSVAAAP